MREIIVDTDLDQIAPVTDFVNEQLKEIGCSDRVRIQIDVAIDELFGNIIRYAYGEEKGPATVQMEVEEDPLSVILTFIDQGIPFNPLTKEMPDTTGLKAKQRPIGGLGLFMVKKTMDDISYEYRDGKNILMIRKII